MKTCAEVDPRELRLAERAISCFGLDLTGATVLTEAASGPFRWTPLLALLAGAQRVYTYAAPNRYGTADELQDGVARLARSLGVEAGLSPVRDKLEAVDSDIVTNVGGLRPIDANFISRLRPTAVIALMWETWEFRPSDLDLAACYHHDILVLGTDEHAPELGIFDYVGAVAVKLLFECGIEVVRGRVVVVGGGAFGEAGIRLLLAAGARVDHVAASPLPFDGLAYRWIGPLLGGARDAIADADALLFLEHEAERLLIGDGGDLSVPDLVACNPSVRIAHVSGAIDFGALAAAGIPVHPTGGTGQPRVMSVTTAYVGPRPVIDLHAAGLRVGEAMWRARTSCASVNAARESALRHPLCQDFSVEQLRALGIRVATGLGREPGSPSL